jgi:hypothetical protein
MDPATAAAMSDPDKNWWFRGRWRDETTPQCSKLTSAAGRAEALELTSRKLLDQWRRERAAESC